MDKESMVIKAISLIRQGYGREKIVRNIESLGFDGREIYEIAKCRINIGNKFSKRKLYFDIYGLRYSTPEIIGKYRAERIRGYKIADISCGVGMQAIFLASTNLEILCVDINPRRIEYAKRNAIPYKIQNIKFMVGNCFDEKIYKEAKNYDVIYSDPARSEMEGERTLENLRPSPIKIIERYGKERTYVFDLPPQISQNKVPKNWEKEYISLNGRIRRLTAYLGELYQHDRRAVALPSGEIIYSDNVEDFTLKMEFSDFIYIVDESIYYSGLMGTLEKKYPLWYLQIGKRRTLASSSILIKSGFLRAFKVFYFSNNIQEIIKFLRKEGYGKITLRLNIDPKKYWILRKNLEKRLEGEKKASLFKVGNDYVVGVECNIT